MKILWLIIIIAVLLIIGISAWYAATLPPGTYRGGVPMPPPQPAPGSAEEAAALESELNTIDIGELDADLADLESQL